MPDPFPRFYRIRQTFDDHSLNDVELAVRDGIFRFSDRIKVGGRIGIAVGSRGIYQYARIVKAVVDQVKNIGAEPVLIPAMGSHGGATADGQIALLTEYGIAADSMGCAILSSMKTVVLGYTAQGMPVHFDQNAYGLDGVIMVNRVKPHTDFHATIESGVVKQMVIGLGKHAGAIAVHRRGLYGLTNLIPEAARIILDKAPILMGVAIIENAFDRTAVIEVIPSEYMLEREQELLEMSKALMPSLPFEALDILALEEMGKNISGTGIDPNIVGRIGIRNVPDRMPDIYRIVCLDLTEESHGNAIGVGLADVITRRLRDKIDLEMTYVNVFTSGFLERGFIPIIAESDHDALTLALDCCNRYLTKETARIVFSKNTLSLGELIISEALLPEAEKHTGIQFVGEAKLNWRDDGSLESLFKET